MRALQLHRLPHIYSETPRTCCAYFLLSCVCICWLLFMACTAGLNQVMATDLPTLTPDTLCRPISRSITLFSRLYPSRIHSCVPWPCLTVHITSCKLHVWPIIRVIIPGILSGTICHGKLAQYTFYAPFRPNLKETTPTKLNDGRGSTPFEPRPSKSHF